MAFERAIDVNEDPRRTAIRHALFPLTKPGVSRTLRNMGPFESLMYLCYIVNMIVLALPNGYDDVTSEKTHTLKGLELFFTALYMLEIIISGAAFGFQDLLHPVRLMDLLLVLANLTILAAFFRGSSTLRLSLLPARCSLRLLRPFFVTTEFPSIRLFVVSVARSIMQLSDVTLLYIFFLLWFGVAGVFQFGGVLQTKCVSDFYNLGALTDPAAALNFFGPASSASWTVTHQNSTLNPLTLSSVYSSVIPISLFGTVINNTAVSEQMLVAAIYSFASSFIAFYQYELLDFVCGSYTENSPLNPSAPMTQPMLAQLVAAALTEEVTPPPTRRYGHRLVPQAPARRRSITVTATPYNGTFSLTRTSSPTLQTPTIGYEYSDLIPPDQLLRVLMQVFNLNQIISCSSEQTCGKVPASTLTGFICPYSYTCLPNVANPYNGTVNFDNIGMSMLTLFTSNTFELWYEVMWMQRGGSDQFALAFMPLEILLGPFMILSLLVVVLTVEFNKAKAMERARIEAEKAAIEQARLAAANGHPGDASSGGAKKSTHFQLFRFSGKKADKNVKSKEDQEQEKEDADEAKRAKGSGFFNLVLSVKKQRSTGNGETADEREPVAEDPAATAPPECTASQEEEEPSQPAATASLRSLGLVSMLRTKLKARLSLKRGNNEEQPCGDGPIELVPMNPSDGTATSPDGSNTATAAAAPQPPPPVKREESSDSEEEFRREELLDNASFAATQSTRDALADSDEDSDGDEPDSQKRRRRLARRILRRKLAKETNPRKALFRRARFYAKWYIVETWWFTVAYTCVVVGSTISTCLWHFGQSPEFERGIQISNIFFTIALVVELAARMMADTASRFRRKAFNIFDACNVTVAVLELFLGDYVPLLRALRIFRVFKLLDTNEELKKWILFIVQACTASPMLVFILFLVMFMFATFGMQLLGGQFCGLDIAGPSSPADTMFFNTTTVATNYSLVNGTLLPTNWTTVSQFVDLPSQYTTDCANLPRANFDNFGNAMLTSFIVATGDNWNYCMYNAMVAVNYAAAIPFVVYYYVAQYVLISLLVSIMISAAQKEGESAEELLEQQRQAQQEAEKKQQQGGPADAPSSHNDPLAVQEYTEEDVEKMLQDTSDQDDDDADDNGEDEEDEEITDVIVSKKGRVKEKTRAAKVVEELARMWSRSRRPLRLMAEHPIFQTLMMINVLVGTIGMGFEGPLTAPDAAAAVTSRSLDLTVNAIFITELLLYVHIYGFVRKPTSYLRRDGWNILDFTVIVCNMTALIALRESSLDSTSRIVFFFSFLRAMRPLRVIRRATGMRRVISTVLGALPEMKNIFIVTVMIFAAWGVFGVFFFQGQLRTCYTPDGSPQPELTETQCESIGGKYINTDLNFDNVGAAMLMIFCCATLETWSFEMLRVMDTDGIGQPARKNANAAAALYFVIAAAIGGLLIMNLFESVLISSYNERKRKAAFQRSVLLTKEQEAWITTNKRLARLLPIRDQEKMARDHEVCVTSDGRLIFHTQVSMLTPETVVQNDVGKEIAARVAHQVSQVRVRIREVTRTETFANLFLAIVFVNFIITAIVHYPQDAGLTNTIQTMQAVFTIAFVVEAALKIAGETFAVYFSSQWNRLDFIVAVVSLCSLILNSVYDAKPFSLVQTMRVTRLARLTKEYFTLDKMIAKFAGGILALGHILSLIVMVFFIFAVLGMKMFGRVQQAPFGGSGNGGASDGIDTNANFGTLGNSLLLLMRMMRGGDWIVVMNSCSQAYTPPPYLCDADIGNCGLEAPAAELYFVIFMFISMFVLSNLFTAVLLDAFSSGGLSRAIRKKEADVFFENWKTFDPNNTLTINPYDVLPFVRSLPRECVLGFNGRPKRKRVGLELNFLASLQLTDVSHPVTWVAMVDALCKAAYPIPMNPRQSVAYLVFSDLMLQPLQQFAQIGKNISELTGAAQALGKSAFSNMQRLTRLVSGKKVRRRGRSRRSKSGRFDANTDGDVGLIHQDVMMFLSSVPNEMMFNPKLLPPVVYRALKIIAQHTRDVRMIEFLNLSQKRGLEDDDTGSYKPPIIQPLKSNSSIVSNSAVVDDVSAEGAGLTPVEAHAAEEEHAVSHSHDLYPETHAVMALLQPSDIKELFLKCSSLVMINAVVKKRRARLAKRVLEAKIEKEIVAKLQRDLGIVVPEALLRSGAGSNRLLMQSPMNSSHSRRGTSFKDPARATGSALPASNNGSPISPNNTDVATSVPNSSGVVLDKRFSVVNRLESTSEQSASSTTANAKAVGSQGQGRSASFAGTATKGNAQPSLLFDYGYRPPTLPPPSTELIPEPEALLPLKWQETPASATVAPKQPPMSDSDVTSVLSPFHHGELLAFVRQDPILLAQVLEELRVFVTKMNEIVDVQESWAGIAGKLADVEKPIVAQGLSPFVVSEETTTNLEHAIFRGVCTVQSVVAAFKRVATASSVPNDNEPDRILQRLSAATILPALGRVNMFDPQLMARQLEAAKSRQNEQVQLIMKSYATLRNAAAQLESNIVASWPKMFKEIQDNAAKQLLAELNRDVAAWAKGCHAAILAGATLPRTVQKRRGNTTTQVQTGGVNASSPAYRWIQCYRTIEIVRFLLARFENIRALRMIPNPDVAQTASSLKAVQYYYSVVDLAEVNARRQSGVAKATSSTVSFKDAIDRLVTNSLFQSPSPVNVDAALAQLAAALDATMTSFSESGQSAQQKETPQPASPQQRKMRSATVIASGPSPTNTGMAKVLSMMAQKEDAQDTEAQAPPLHVTLNTNARHTIESSHIEFAPSERDDPYLSSVLNFCTTLSKSEQMKEQSTSRAASVSGRRSTVGPSAATDKRDGELLTLQEYCDHLDEKLVSFSKCIADAALHSMALAHCSVDVASDALHSALAVKLQMTSDMTAFTVRTTIVTARRDELNRSVQALQDSRQAVVEAEAEREALQRILNNSRPLLSSATRRVVPAAAPVASFDPKSAETAAAEVVDEKIALCPFAVQPNARAQQQCADGFQLFLLLQDTESSVFDSITPFTVKCAQNTKLLLKFVARHGFSYAPPVTARAEMLYRSQPQYATLVDACARDSGKLIAAMTSFQRAFNNLLVFGIELVGEVHSARCKPQRARTTAPLEVNDESLSVEELLLQQPLASSNEREGVLPNASVDQPEAHSGVALEMTSTMESHESPASPTKRNHVTSTASPPRQRTREQILADATARLEARKRGEPFVSSAQLDRTTNSSASPASMEKSVSSFGHSAVAAEVLLPIIERLWTQKPKPPRESISNTLQRLLSSGLAVRYFSISSPKDVVPRSEFLFFPGLLRAFVGESTSASSAVQTLRIAVTKKAKTDFERTSFTLSHIARVRTGLSLTRDVDCFPANLPSAAAEWSALCDRLVAVNVAHGPLELLLLPSVEDALLFGNVLDALVAAVQI